MMGCCCWIRATRAWLAPASRCIGGRSWMRSRPRARFRLLEHRIEDLLARTGITASDVSRPDVDLLSRILPSSPTHWPPEVFERHLLESFEVALHEALAKAHMGEGTPFSPVDSMRSEVKKSAAKLR